MYNACDRAAPFGSRVKKRDRLGLYCLTEPVRPKAKAMNRADDEVWVSGSQGYCYHKAGCGKLNQSHTVTSTTRSEAEARGYRGCRICHP